MADRPVLLVTGSSRGIGRHLSEHYLALGYDVVGCSRAAPSEPMPANFVHVAADVTVAKDVERLFAEIRTRFGVSMWPSTTPASILASRCPC